MGIPGTLNSLRTQQTMMKQRKRCSLLPHASDRCDSQIRPVSQYCLFLWVYKTRFVLGIACPSFLIRRSFTLLYILRSFCLNCKFQGVKSNGNPSYAPDLKYFVNKNKFLINSVYLNQSCVNLFTLVLGHLNWT